MAFRSLDLDDLRSQEQGRIRKPPSSISWTPSPSTGAFTFTTGEGKGGVACPPDRSGKTFTTVKWLCDQVVRPKPQDSLARPLVLPARSSVQRDPRTTPAGFQSQDRR